MEEMDQLLRELPNQPPPPDLSQRMRCNFRQRLARFQRARRIASLSLIALGSALMLPGMFGLNIIINLPESGLGWARTGIQVLAEPQSSLLTLPGLLDQLQSGMWAAIPGTIWIGAGILAAGAFLSLGCWMPRNTRSVMG